MEEPLKAIGSIVALIGGLVALIKGALDVMKEYQANKATLGALFARPRFWIAASLSVVGIAALIGAVWWRTSHSEYVLTVQIWDVVADTKSTVLASERFTGSAGNSLPDETLRQAGGWIARQIGQKYNTNANALEVRARVPADLETDNLDIRFTPPTAHKIYFWTVSEGGKGRVPVEQQALARLRRNFELEINVPGYGVRTMSVTWGQALERTLNLAPAPVAIGIEEFTGEKNSVSTWLSYHLTANPRFSVKDPNALKALRDEIAQQRAIIAANPAIQLPLRESLGLQVIISGRYERP